MGKNTFAEALDDIRERIRLTPAEVIGNRIRTARKEFGSHDSLARAVGGTSRQHLIKLEQGRHRPGAEMLIAIADATGKPLEFFVKGGEAPFRRKR